MALLCILLFGFAMFFFYFIEVIKGKEAAKEIKKEHEDSVFGCAFIIAIIIIMFIVGMSH